MLKNNLRNKFVNLIFAATVCAAVLAMSAPAALAARTITSATLNGGASVTVLPGATITANVIGDLTAETDGWHGTQWRISKTPPGITECADTNNFDDVNAGAVSGNFNITAPSAVGTYNVYFLMNAESACGGSSGGLITLTDALTVALPDLTVTKTNSLGGANAHAGTAFNWVLTVTNVGNGPAVFADTNVILADNLPDASTVTYGVATAVNTGGTTGTVNCSISLSKDLSCVASGGVVIPAGGAITVTFSAVSSVIGALSNPRIGGICAVDPSLGLGLITEADETNNSCSDSVTVGLGAINNLVITSIDSTISAGQTATFTASGTDQYGNVLPDQTGLTLFSVVENPTDGGNFLANVYTSRVAGAWHVIGNVGGVTSTPFTLTVNPGAISKLTVTALPASLTTASTSTLTLAGKDQYGNVVTSSNGTAVSLLASNSGVLGSSSLVLASGLATTTLNKISAGNVIVTATSTELTSGSTTVNFTMVAEAASPTAIPAPGTYSSAQSIQLSAAGSSSIRYTTDGSVPTCSSGTVYISAISVAASATIRAVACYEENSVSAVASFGYVITTASGGGGGGSITTGSISGLVYSDINNDGIFNASTDIPLSGWTVYLDANNNGVLDNGEVFLKTYADGRYNFSNLPFGLYVLREVTQTGFKQAEPAKSEGYALTLSSFIPNAESRNFGNRGKDRQDQQGQQGEVLGASTDAGHPSGSLVLDGHTVYLIAAGRLNPFRDPQEFLSYGYKFSQVIIISSVDKLLPFGDILKAMPGTLVLDTTDNRTVYIVGQDYNKRGFASYRVFADAGYAENFGSPDQTVHGIFKINLADYPAQAVITSALDPHPEGALVKDSAGTVWWVLGGKRYGFSSVAIFNSHGFTFNRVVPANVADLILPVGSLVKSRSETLVRYGKNSYSE